MKFTLKIVLVSGLALPFASCGMDFSAITKRRGAYADQPSSPREQTSSADSSLDPITADAIRESLAQDENNANASKAQALNQATNANKAIEQNAEVFISRAQSSTPKIPKSHLHEKARGIKHSNSHIDIDNLTKDEEWGDGIISAPPALPPFPLSDEDGALPDLPEPTPELEKIDALILRYENESAPVPRRSLPPAPVYTDPGLQARPFDPSRASGQATQDRITIPGVPVVRPPVDTPIIEEIPEPKGEESSALRHENLSPEDQKNTDFTEVREPESRGVREERTPAKAPRRPVPVYTNSPVAKASSFARPMADKPSNAASNNVLNLLVSAGLFGFTTWLEHNLENKFESSMHQTIAQEFTLAAQQAAAGNIAQQILPGKQSSSAAFTTAFLTLHACEIGLKRLCIKIFAQTKGGKKIAAAYQKMPSKKRKIIDHAASGASWLFKTLIARSLAQ